MPTKEKQAERLRHRETYKGTKIDVMATTKRELNEKVYRKKTEIDSGIASASTGVTVEEWATKWLEVYKKPKITAHAYSTYAAIVNAHVIPKFGAVPLSGVSNAALTEFINSFAGMSYSYTSRAKITIQGIFRTAKLNGIIASDPTEGIELPKTKKGSHRSMTDEETKLFLKVCDTNPHGLWALFMFYCGLRPGEASALCWSDIDKKNNILSVRRAVEAAAKRIKETKSAAGNRDIPIPAEFAEIIKVAKSKANSSETMFLTENNTIADAVVQGRWWKSIRRDMNLAAGAQITRNHVDDIIAPDLTPYCLRHTYCTNLEKVGVPINIAKVLMGHSSIELTANIYTHHDSSQIEMARKMIDAGTCAGTKKQ